MNINEKIKKLRVNLDSKALKANKVVIVPHNNVDFDAIGSAIGLSLVCKKLKKESFILINDPIYQINPGCKKIIDESKKEFNIIDKTKYEKIKHNQDLYILTDVNKQHLVSIADTLKNPDKIVIIDHHKEDEKTILSDIQLIEPDISSSSEIVHKLLNEYKIKIPINVANYLLAGIYLDTNRFTKNATATTMSAVSKLMIAGASINKVNSWFTEDFESDRRVQKLVSTIKLVEHKIAIIMADNENEYSTEELAKAADYALKYGPDATFAIGNIGENTVRISARSNEKVDVGSVMRELGGGGNNYSAAAQMENTNPDDVRKQLIKMFQPPYYISE